MDEKHSSASTDQRSASLPPKTTALKLDPDNSEYRKQNCLCAPTTHAGSFRCRLHRLPPPPPTPATVKKGTSSQKLLPPKVKLALPHKLKQDCSKRSSSSSSSQLHPDKPGLSRLSRTFLANEQIPPFHPDTEALTVLWSTSGTASAGEGARHHVKHVESCEVDRENLLPSSSKSFVRSRPLVRLPSI